MSEDQALESIPLTDGLRDTILRYLELRNETGEMGFWMLPMETARRDIGFALLEALEMATSPKRADPAETVPEAAGGRRRRAIPFIVRAKVMARDNFECVKCTSKLDLTVDHIFPHSKGGSDDEGNLQTLCGRCNRSKGTQIERP